MNETDTGSSATTIMLTPPSGEITIDAMARKPTRKGRPRLTQDQSPFGHWLDQAGKSRNWAAQRLKVTRGFLDKLARGHGLPSLVTAADIEKLTSGDIGLQEWAKFAKTRPAPGRHDARSTAPGAAKRSSR